jgi:hypothetical protein
MTANEVIGNLENKAFPSPTSSSKKITAAAEQIILSMLVIRRSTGSK